MTAELQDPPPHSAPRGASRGVGRVKPAGIIGAVAGLLLFVYFVRTAGLEEILKGLQKVGAGFLAILALSALREMARTLAWTRAVEPPARLKFLPAFRARIMGEALGNLTPFSLFVSEPAKAVLVGDRVGLMAALSAIAIENIFYSLSVALVVVAGVAALLWSFNLPPGLEWTAILAAAGVIAAVIALFWVLTRRIRVLSRAAGWLSRRGPGTRLLGRRLGSIRTLEERVYRFHQGRGARVLAIAALELGFHLSAIAEVYVTLALLRGAAPTLLSAFILESVDRVITVVFKFVPMRLGVDEAGTGLVAAALQMGTITGVTLAIVRKARVLCWTAVGVALLVHRGLSVRRVVAETEQAVEHAGLE